MSESLFTVRKPLVIEQVENALLERLKQDVSGQCKVENFPNDPRKFDFANLPAALLVHYSGSQYASPKGPAGTAQARTMSFELILLCRSLRGEGGAYNHVEDIRLSVHGNSFAGAGPAVIMRDQLDEENQGVWRWNIRIALAIPAVPRTLQAPAALMRPAFS